MYLVNDKNEKLVDIYDIRLDDKKFNEKKFKEIIGLSNMKLDKNFVYKNMFNSYISYGKGPLYYPISTLLLARYMLTELKDLVNREMLEYIMETLQYYDPTDLFSISYLIEKDEFFNEEFNTPALEEHLKTVDKDIVIFREIFRHMDFDYMTSIDISDLRNYVIGHRNGKFVSYMYNKYAAYEDAKRNTKVLKLLNLNPNINKDI